MIVRLHRWIRLPLLLALTSCVASTACGGPAKTTQTIQPVVTKSATGLLSWHDLPNPGVWDTSLGIIMSWVTSPLGQAPVHEDLARVDPKDGHIEAERSIPGSILDAVASSSTGLFVSVSSSAGLSLLRIDRRTLVTIHSWLVSGRGNLSPGRGFIVSAGGGVWLSGGDRLDRISPSRNTVVKATTLPGAATSEVTTNSAGSVLLVSVANQSGSGYVERRDPITGALLGTSSTVVGVAGPLVEGIVGDYFWTNVATGTMGYTRLYSLSDLAPAGPSCPEGLSNLTCIVGSNDLGAELTDGLLWITQTAGGPARNFCGEADGEVLATLPQNVVAIGTQNSVLFVLGSTLSPNKGSTLSETPIPKACT